MDRLIKRKERKKKKKRKKKERKEKKEREIKTSKWRKEEIRDGTVENCRKTIHSPHE